MNRRREEALQSVQEEGMVEESTFLEQTTEGNFLIVILIAKDFERAKEVGRFLTHSIDAYHRKFRDAVTLERTDLDLLVDFNRIEEGS